MLQLEVDAFRAQVSGMVPDVSIAPKPVVNSLVLLDRQVIKVSQTLSTCIILT